MSGRIILFSIKLPCVIGYDHFSDNGAVKYGLRGRLPPKKRPGKISKCGSQVSEANLWVMLYRARMGSGRIWR